MTGLAHVEIQELLGAYAVDALHDVDERTVVEEHLESCADCRLEVDLHRATLATLTPDAAVAPDPVWESIVAAIAAEEPRPVPTAAPPGAPDNVIPFRPRRRIAVWLAPAAAAAAAVLVTLSLTGGNDLGTPVARAAVQPFERATGVAGLASLYRTDRPNGRIRLVLRNVPVAPAGHHYEVWVLRPGADVEMEAIGAFTPEDGEARLVLPLPGPGEYVAVDISVQENGGPPEHSGTSLARALFQ